MRSLLVLCALVGCGNVASPEVDAPVELVCAANEMKCGDVCADIDNDPDHCGGCSPCNLENATAGCVQGQCVVAACATGFCDADGIGGCEVQPDLNSDVNHCGACNRVCGSNRCNNGACALRAFVTAGTYSGNLGGLAGADEKCQIEAASQGLTGTWMAWLADSTSGPATRFSNTAGLFVRVNTAVVIANDFTDLTDGTLDNAILTLGNGVTAPTPNIWSNVTTSGTPKGMSNCMDWTSSSSSLQGARGASNSATGTWTDSSSTQNCNPAVIPGLRLLCFEQ